MIYKEEKIKKFLNGKIKKIFLPLNVIKFLEKVKKFKNLNEYKIESINKCHSQYYKVEENENCGYAIEYIEEDYGIHDTLIINLIKKHTRYYNIEIHFKLTPFGVHVTKENQYISNKHENIIFKCIKSDIYLKKFIIESFKIKTLQYSEYNKNL